MRRTELSEELKHEYRAELACGVEKIGRPELKNIWFVVPPAPPRKLPANLPARALARANAVISGLPAYEAATALDRMVSYLFVRREAVQSSRIEGTWSTISAVLTPGEVYNSNDGRAARASVLGYAHALESEIDRIRENGVAGFSLESVSRLHREIMRHDPFYKGKPGVIREPDRPGDVVWIGPLGRPEDSIYNPAPPRHVARCFAETVAWMRDEELVEFGNAGMGLPLPVRMAIGHSHFEAVHPFPDGNGRVGRMLLTLQMAAHGVVPLYLSGFIESEKESYVRALQSAQKKLRYGSIVELVCAAIVDTHHEAEKTKSIITGLPAAWRERGGFRDKSAALRFLPLLVSHPVFTAADIARLLKISPPAANRAASQLVQRGIARQRSKGAWGRVFAAEEVIELLSRRFGEDPRMALSRAAELLGGPQD